MSRRLGVEVWLRGGWAVDLFLGRGAREQVGIGCPPGSTSGPPLRQPWRHTATGTNATCTGTLPPGTYQNVTVPAQATCNINGSDIITGNVTVATGATLTSFGASIGGNLQADHAQFISVNGS